MKKKNKLRRQQVRFVRSLVRGRTIHNSDTMIKRMEVLIHIPI
jgi:hypothetical protein